jgi:hypothetical protein
MQFDFDSFFRRLRLWFAGSSSQPQDEDEKTIGGFSDMTSLLFGEKDTDITAGLYAQDYRRIRRT